MNIKMNPNIDHTSNNEIVLSDMTNDEFDRVRILLKTLADYGNVFSEENSESLSLSEVIKSS